MKIEDKEKKNGKTIEKQIIDGIKEENIPVQIYDGEERNSTDFGMLSVADYVKFKKSAIISIASSAQFSSFWKQKIFRDLMLRRGGASLYFYVFNATIEDILEADIRLIAETNSVYLVVDEKHYLKLMTFVKYIDGHCGHSSFKLIEINRFSKKLKKWLGLTIAVSRSNNLHGCKLALGLSGDSRGKAAIKILKIEKPVQSQYYEITQKLFEVLASNLNFSLVFDFEGVDDRKTSIGLIPAIGFERNMVSGMSRTPMTRPYLYQNVYVAVPVGEKVGDFEKLLLPFDDAIWFWICLTFFAAFSTIFILRFQSESVRTCVIGHNVSTPALNVLIVFFGLSKIRLPRKNFPRFMMMLFIMYSLIIRTAWQGKMFEFLQKDLRKPEKKSIAELMQNNFTLYFDERSLGSLKETEFKKSSTISFETAENILANLSGKLNDPKFKGAVQCLNDILKYQAIATNGTFLRRILKETIYIKGIVIFMPNLRFVEIIDEKIGQLWEAGIIDHFNLDYNQYVNPKRYDYLHPEGPEVLTLEHLRAGFVIWLVSVVLALLSFVGEWISRLIDLMIVHSLFSIFYDIKRSENSAKFECYMKKILKNSTIEVDEQEEFSSPINEVSSGDEA